VGCNSLAKSVAGDFHGFVLLEYWIYTVFLFSWVLLLATRR